MASVLGQRRTGGAQGHEAPDGGAHPAINRDGAERRSGGEGHRRDPRGRGCQRLHPRQARPAEQQRWLTEAGMDYKVLSVPSLYTPEGSDIGFTLEFPDRLAEKRGALVNRRSTGTGATEGVDGGLPPAAVRR
jgi:hypothetical protein